MDEKEQREQGYEQRGEHAEAREERQEEREKRHEAREILSAREADELKFKREHDYENLAKIPTIEQTVNEIKLLLASCDVRGMKTDQDWMKRFFWLIAGAVVTQGIATICLLVFKRV